MLEHLPEHSRRKGGGARVGGIRPPPFVKPFVDACGDAAIWLCGYMAMRLCGYVAILNFVRNPGRWPPVNVPVAYAWFH